MTALLLRAAWTALLWGSCSDEPASLRAVEAAILSLPESARMAIEDHVGRLLELRLRWRSNLAYRALANRALIRVTQAEHASLRRQVEIEIEVLRILETLDDSGVGAETSRH